MDNMVIDNFSEVEIELNFIKGENDDVYKRIDKRTVEQSADNVPDSLIGVDNNVIQKIQRSENFEAENHEDDEGNEIKF